MREVGFKGVDVLARLNGLDLKFPESLGLSPRRLLDLNLAQLARYDGIEVVDATRMGIDEANIFLVDCGPGIP
jgi:hypothetical protein